MRAGGAAEAPAENAATDRADRRDEQQILMLRVFYGIGAVFAGFQALVAGMLLRAAFADEEAEQAMMLDAGASAAVHGVVCALHLCAVARLATRPAYWAVLLAAVVTATRALAAWSAGFAPMSVFGALLWTGVYWGLAVFAGRLGGRSGRR